MALQFCAIDFETASWDRASAIQVGIVKVRNGEVVDAYAQLIQPADGFNDFSDDAIAIHHITPDMVASAPSWADIYPEVHAFIGGDRLISYNARFDGQVFASTSLIADLPDTTVEMGCALTWAQRTLGTLPNHRLPTVAQFFGYDLTHHHDATADALACAHIVIGLAGLHQVDSVDALAAQTSSLFTRFQPDKKTIVAYQDRERIRELDREQTLF